MWPRAETTVTFGGHELVLKPATRETDQSVHINLRKISDVDALTLINRFLSVLAWCDDQPMENGYGWLGNSVSVAVSRESRVIGSSIAFPFNRDVEGNRNSRLALALYREGRSVNSVPYAFLSYFKILNMFWKDKYVNGRNELVEGIRTTLPTIRDGRASERILELQKSEPDIPKYLYESGRCAIAHAHTDPIVDPDNVSELRRLSQDIHVIKAIAAHLIQVELGVSRSIFG